MSWVGPVAKNAAKYGAKYGPHAKVAWEVAGKHVQAAARSRMDAATLRRKAFDQAAVTREGSVLRVVEAGEPVFVVFSGDEPVESYPPTAHPLDELVARADLAQRTTPEEHREQQLRARVLRAAERLPRPGRDKD